MAIARAWPPHGPRAPGGTPLPKPRGREIIIGTISDEILRFFGPPERHQKFMLFWPLSKTLKIEEEMTQGRFQIDFWMNFHSFWEPFWHRFLNFFTNGENHEFIAQGIVLEGFSIQKTIVFQYIFHHFFKLFRESFFGIIFCAKNTDLCSKC